MPLILLLTMIAIFFYYNAQENIRGFYKTRGFQGKVQITGIGWADKITYRMNKEDEVKHYLIFHIDYQETINNKKEHVNTQLPLHIQDLLYLYIASPTESDSDFNRQNSEYKILPDEREYGDDFIKKSIKINPRNQKFINDISKALSTEKDLKNIFQILRKSMDFRICIPGAFSLIKHWKNIGRTGADISICNLAGCSLCLHK